MYSRCGTAFPRSVTYPSLKTLQCGNRSAEMFKNVHRVSVPNSGTKNYDNSLGTIWLVARIDNRAGSHRHHPPRPQSTPPIGWGRFLSGASRDQGRNSRRLVPKIALDFDASNGISQRSSWGTLMSRVSSATRLLLQDSEARFRRDRRSSSDPQLPLLLRRHRSER